MTGDVLMSRVKSCLSMFKWDRQANQAIYGEAKAILSEIRLEWSKEKRAMEEAFKAQRAEEAKAKPRLTPMTEEELSDSIDILLTTKVNNQTISAAEIAQLSSIRNLKKKDRDITIQTVNYKDLP